MRRKITRYIKYSVNLSDIYQYGTLMTPIIESFSGNIDEYWDNIIGAYLIEEETRNVTKIVELLFADGYLLPNSNFFDYFIVSDFNLYPIEVTKRFHNLKEKNELPF